MKRDGGPVRQDRATHPSASAKRPARKGNSPPRGNSSRPCSSWCSSACWGLAAPAGWPSFVKPRARFLPRPSPANLAVADLLHMAWQLFWQHLLPLAMGGMAVAVATLGYPAGHHAFRSEPQEAGARSATLQHAQQAAGTAAAESAIAATGHGSAAGVSVGRLCAGARQTRGGAGASAGQRGERRRLHRHLADGVVLESRRGVSGLRSGGSVPPDAPPHSATCA